MDRRLAAGAPKSELDAIKAASAPNDGSDALDLSAMETFGAGADARSRPDAVFVSDDEADQEAMSEVIARSGLPGSRGAGFESSRGTTRAAFFESDGTSRDPTSSRARARVASRICSAWLKFFWVPFYLLKCVLYLIVDAFNRSAFNTVDGASAGLPSDPDAKAAMAATVYDAYLRRNIFPAAARTIAELKSDGFDVVLVTGSIDFLVDAGERPGRDGGYREHARGERRSVHGLARRSPRRRRGETRAGARVRGEARRGSRGVARVRRFHRGCSHARVRRGILRTPPSAKLRTEATRRGWDVLEWTVDENGAEGNAGSGGCGVSDSHGVNTGRGGGLERIAEGTSRQKDPRRDPRARPMCE